VRFAAARLQHHAQPCGAFVDAISRVIEFVNAFVHNDARVSTLEKWNERGDVTWSRMGRHTAASLGRDAESSVRPRL
jgi:hypothetical protein